MKYRLAILTSHVIQYQDPLFRRLAAEADIDLTVLFGSRMGAERYLDWDLGVELSWDLEMLQGYRHVFLRNLSPKPLGGFWSRINPGVVGALARGRYDAVVIMGWGSVTSWFAFLTCLVIGTPFLLSGDNSFVDDTPATIRGRVRRFVLQRLFARTAGFLLMGAMNGDFYRHFGADAGRFFLVPYAIDNERFEVGSAMSEAEREALRRELDIAPSQMVVLFSGKLIPRKQPLHALLAVERMQHRDRVSLVFMGDGSERQMLETYAHEHGIDDVHFLGFVNQTRMPRIYGMSDVMVLPSTYDPRGTVVNEAMACGLPVVITDRVGVYGDGDIVRDGENGFVYPADSIERLATILDTLAVDPALRARMGARSREIIGTWDYDRDVEGILAALKATVPRTQHAPLAMSREAS